MGLREGGRKGGDSKRLERCVVRYSRPKRGREETGGGKREQKTQ